MNRARTAILALDHWPYVARLSFGVPAKTLEDKGVFGNDGTRLRDALLKERR